MNEPELLVPDMTDEQMDLLAQVAHTYWSENVGDKGGVAFGWESLSEPSRKRFRGFVESVIKGLRELVQPIVEQSVSMHTLSVGDAMAKGEWGPLEIRKMQVPETILKYLVGQSKEGTVDEEFLSLMVAGCIFLSLAGGGLTKGESGPCIIPVDAMALASSVVTVRLAFREYYSGGDK